LLSIYTMENIFFPCKKIMLLKIDVCSFLKIQEIMGDRKF